jgi:hypothetical protein
MFFSIIWCVYHAPSCSSHCVFPKTMNRDLSICLQIRSSQLISLSFLGSVRAVNMSSINRFESLNRLLVHWYPEGATCPSIGCLHSPLCGDRAKQVSLSVFSLLELLLRESVCPSVSAAISSALMIASYGNSTIALT